MQTTAHSIHRLNPSPSSQMLAMQAEYPCTACSSRGRQTGHRHQVVCQAASNTPAAPADRRKSERSAARRRPRTLPPPPIEDANPDDIPRPDRAQPRSRAAESPLDPDWADSEAESSPSGETVAIPMGQLRATDNTDGNSANTLNSESDDDRVTSQRRRPEEPIPEDDIPMDSGMELQPDAELEELASRPHGWEGSARESMASVEVEAEVVNYPGAQQVCDRSTHISYRLQPLPYGIENALMRNIEGK